MYTNVLYETYSFVYSYEILLLLNADSVIKTTTLQTGRNGFIRTTSIKHEQTQSCDTVCSFVYKLCKNVDSYVTQYVVCIQDT